jgi:hypothetical protein
VCDHDDDRELSAGILAAIEHPRWRNVLLGFLITGSIVLPSWRAARLDSGAVASGWLPKSRTGERLLMTATDVLLTVSHRAAH